MKEGKPESERNEETKNEERRNDRYKENAIERKEKRGKLRRRSAIIAFRRFEARV